jgi:hypothetical protein
MATTLYTTQFASFDEAKTAWQTYLALAEKARRSLARCRKTESALARQEDIAHYRAWAEWANGEMGRLSFS